MRCLMMWEDVPHFPLAGMQRCPAGTGPGCRCQPGPAAETWQRTFGKFNSARKRPLIGPSPGWKCLLNRCLNVVWVTAGFNANLTYCLLWSLQTSVTISHLLAVFKCECLYNVSHSVLINWALWKLREGSLTALVYRLWCGPGIGVIYHLQLAGCLLLVTRLIIELEKYCNM